MIEEHTYTVLFNPALTFLVITENLKQGQYAYKTKRKTKQQGKKQKKKVDMTACVIILLLKINKK